MENNTAISKEYKEYINSNPDIKFVVYLRIHPHDELEKDALRKLSILYGDYKELNEERIAIFIVFGEKVIEFMSNLEAHKTNIYISYIQSEDELLKSRK